MFKKIAFFALFLAVTGLFAATSINAQRLIKGSLAKTADTSFDVLEPEANEAIDLRQCANGQAGSSVDCLNDGGPDQWVTGKAGQQNAHYAEDRSIHYTARLSNLVVGRQYTLTLGYDIIENNNPLIHAIDFLTNYDADIVPGDYEVFPCGSATYSATHPCTTGLGLVQIPIPMDPGVPDTIEPAGRFFTAWGIAAGATMTVPAQGANAAERIVTITFTALETNPVFGWSGHIASSADWAAFGGSGAGAIKGSSYHMRNRGGFDLSTTPPTAILGGNQEVQLGTDAIAAPSAADATISGRVIDRYGRAISSAKMSLYDVDSGEMKVTYTNTFGFYSFKGVPIGDSFVMSVEHRRYYFVTGTTSFSLADNIEGLNFQSSN